MNNRDLEFYIDAAKKAQGYKSDLELGRALNFAGSGVSFWRKKKSLPNDQRMIELAKMAGIDPAVALIDLAMWRTEGETKQTYASILQKLQACILIGAAVIGLSGSPAHAKSVNSNHEILYIMENNIFYSYKAIKALNKKSRQPMSLPAFFIYLYLYN